MSIADPITGPLDALINAAGYTLDTPGALTRGAIGNVGDFFTGKNRTGWRATGREMLEGLGALGPNIHQGLVPDPGDLAGFAADIAVDPLNWLGVGLIGEALEPIRAAKKFNVAADALEAAGGMPQHVVDALHPMFLESPGVPRKFFHGTPKKNMEVRAGKGTSGLSAKKVAEYAQTEYGAGIPFTTLTDRANLGAKNKLGQTSGSVLSAFLDVRDPFYPVPSPRAKNVPTFVAHLKKRGRPGHVIGERQDEMAQAIQSLGHDASLPSEIFPGTYEEAAAHIKATGSKQRPGTEATIFDPKKVYLPYVVPARKALPKAEIPPEILAALLGRNAIQGADRAFD